jgi:hypothetical protein
MRVIANERTSCSRRPNENTQTITPARQIRPRMRGRQKSHFSDALDETQRFGAVGCLVGCLSQDLFDDKTAEAVPGQYQLARPKIRFHQQQIKHIGRTVGQLHRRAIPARHGRIIAHGVNGQAFDVLRQPSRPEGGFILGRLPRGASVAAKAMEENRVGAFLPPCFGDPKNLCHLRPRRGLTDRCLVTPNRGTSHRAVHLMVASDRSWQAATAIIGVYNRISFHYLVYKGHLICNIHIYT